jgi:two-component system chemotaxis response regulator CheY
MKILIVEDDVTSRLLLRKMLEPFGSCDVAVNGKEAVESFRLATESGEPYALVCLDIMMPEMDGQAALSAIRAQEAAANCPPSRAAKIVMTTALRDLENVTKSYDQLCDGYLTKPIRRDKLVEVLKDLGLLELREEHLKS